MLLMNISEPERSKQARYLVNETCLHHFTLKYNRILYDFSAPDEHEAWKDVSLCWRLRPRRRIEYIM